MTLELYSRPIYSRYDSSVVKFDGKLFKGLLQRVERERNRRRLRAQVRLLRGLRNLDLFVQGRSEYFGNRIWRQDPGHPEAPHQ